MNAKAITVENVLIVTRILDTLILIAKVAGFIFAINADIIQQYHIDALINAE